jgi:hypothetical protein
MMIKRSLWLPVLLLLGGLAAVAVWVYELGILSSPEAVARQYAATVYARDYERAYDLISAADRGVKPRQEYLRENTPFTGFTLEASLQLASYIEYRNIRVDRQGDRATITAELVVPDGNAEAVQEILLAANGREVPEAERQALLEKLDYFHASGQIPAFEGEQSFTLVREGGRWRIFENWVEAVRVHFSGEVKHGLAWEFEPVQAVVLAKPGETLQTLYRAKNLSDQPITAKARHIDRPEEYRDYLNIVQCFCLIQQTLQPGEAQEMTLVFRVAWDVPPEAKDFYVHYEFYPVELFPE